MCIVLLLPEFAGLHINLDKGVFTSTQLIWKNQEISLRKTKKKKKEKNVVALPHAVGRCQKERSAHTEAVPSLLDKEWAGL
jgi:hypothetical protein